MSRTIATVYGNIVVCDICWRHVSCIVTCTCMISVFVELIIAPTVYHVIGMYKIWYFPFASLCWSERIIKWMNEWVI